MSNPIYRLDPRLAADTHPVARWDLSDVLLMNDARLPWLILVPRVADATELFHLSSDQQSRLMTEMSGAGSAVQSLWSADKVNTAMLGNKVSQLHIHVIARFRKDDAWPGPVWGVGQPRPYTEAALGDCLNRLRPGLPRL